MTCLPIERRKAICLIIISNQYSMRKKGHTSSEDQFYAQNQVKIKKKGKDSTSKRGARGSCPACPLVNPALLATPERARIAN